MTRFDSFFALGTYLLKKIEFFFYLLDNFQTEQDFKNFSLFYVILLKSNGWFWGHTQINFQHYLLCLKVIFLEFCLILFNSSGRFGHTKITFQHRNLCSKMSINITFLDFTQYCLTVVMVLVTQKVPKK